MAVQTVPNPELIADIGRRYLIDTTKLTVRRITRSETHILGALASLAPAERTTLVAMVDVLGAKKRKGRPPAPQATGGEP